MSATGLGVCFWNDMLTSGSGPPSANPAYSGAGLFEGGVNPAGPAVSPHLLYLAQDHDYAITHVYLWANLIGTAPIRVRLGIKKNGFPLHDVNDGRKVFGTSLDPGQLFDAGTDIFLPGSYGLIGIADAGYGPGFDIGVWATIMGEVRD